MKHFGKGFCSCIDCTLSSQIFSIFRDMLSHGEFQLRLLGHQFLMANTHVIDTKSKTKQIILFD